MTEFLHNPNHALQVLLPRGPMKRFIYPTMLIYSHPQECVVTYPKRSFDIAEALQQALKSMMQLRDVPFADLHDTAQLELELLDGTHLVFTVNENYINATSMHPALNLNTRQFEATMLQQALIHQYVAKKADRILGSHTQIICDLLIQKKVETPSNYCPFESPTRLIKNDIAIFERDVKMLVEEGPLVIGYKDSFVKHIAVPVLLSSVAITKGDKERALGVLHSCAQADWASAAANWVYHKC